MKDLNDLLDHLTPLILAAGALVAWQIKAPEVIWGGLLASALTMLKPSSKSPQS